MGYDSKLWSVLLYVLGPLFIAVQGISNPADYGLSPVLWRWLVLVSGLGALVVAKLGSSWLPKSDSANTVSVTSLAGKVVIPFLLASTLLTGSVFLTGCAAKQYPTLAPETQKQIDATEVAKRVNRLMDSAIAAEDAGSLTRNQTRLIVTFCVDADKTLAQYPNGWGPTLATAWKALKEDPVLKPLLLSNQYVATAATLVDLALAIWTPKAPGPLPDPIPWFLTPQTFSMEVA